MADLKPESTENCPGPEDAQQAGDGSASLQKLPTEKDIKEWRKFVRRIFPNIKTESYLFPPFYFRNIPFRTKEIGGQTVQVLTDVKKGNEQGRAIQIPVPPLDETQPHASSMFPDQTAPPGLELQVCDSDEKGARGEEKVWNFFRVCLFKLLLESERVMVLSQMKYGNHNNKEPGQPTPVDFCLCPAWFAGSKKGEVDFIIISRNYGLILCEVKSVDNQCGTKKFVEKLSKGKSQLDRAENALTELLSSIPTLKVIRITRTFAFPILTKGSLAKMAEKDKIRKNICKCLRVAENDVETAINRCLCLGFISDVEISETPDQRSDGKIHAIPDPHADAKICATKDLMAQARTWWSAVTSASTPDEEMSDDIYESLVAMFCGPDSLVVVNTLSTMPPQLQTRSFGDWIAVAGLVMSQLTLSEEQMEVLQRGERLVLLHGPPGTGKTVVLVLIGLKWLKEGHDVYVISTHEGSRAVSFFIQAQIYRCSQMQQLQGEGVPSPSRVHCRFYNFRDGKHGIKAVDAAINDMKEAAKGGKIHVIVDEAGLPLRTPYFSYSDRFTDFCSKLESEIPDLHLWAATNVYKEEKDSSSEDDVKLKSATLKMKQEDARNLALLTVEPMTTPLRCPHAVRRQVERSAYISDENKYSHWKSGNARTPVGGQKFLSFKYKDEQGRGSPEDSIQCGKRIAGIIKDYKDGSDNTGGLQYRDFLVLCDNPREDMAAARGLQDCGVPVQVVTSSSDDNQVRSMALAEEDKVVISSYKFVAGLERRVVIGVGSSNKRSYNRLYGMSRSTSQLLWLNASLIQYGSDVDDDNDYLESPSSSNVSFECDNADGDAVCAVVMVSSLLKSRQKSWRSNNQ